MALSTYTPGGYHSASAGVQNICDYKGVTAPHTGMPYREELLFGLGGGIGGYFRLERGATSDTRFVLSGRSHPEDGVRFIRRVCERIGMMLREENGPPGLALETVRRYLEAGEPVFVAFDTASLPYTALGIEEIGRDTTHAVIAGYDGERDLVEVDDCGEMPWPLTIGQVQAALAETGRDEAWLAALEPARARVDLDAGCRAALAESAREALGTDGWLTSFEALARSFSEPTGDAGWLTLFPRPAQLFPAFTSVYRALEMDGTRGGFFRGMYADFLLEAAAITGIQELNGPAATIRECADDWSAVANAALPGTEGPFEQARSNLQRIGSHRRHGHLGAIEGIGEEERELAQLAAWFETRFPLSDAETRAMLSDLGARVRELAAKERRAFEELAALVRRPEMARSL